MELRDKLKQTPTTITISQHPVIICFATFVRQPREPCHLEEIICEYTFCIDLSRVSVRRKKTEFDKPNNA